MRSLAAFAAARIPGSTSLPSRDLLAAVGALGGGRVVTYCGGGISATLDAFALTLLGEPDVAVYDGSMAEWTSGSALPIERG
jgi:thiosulfate/3-mercaptopyruvate sulfurtransferase